MFSNWKGMTNDLHNQLFLMSFKTSMSPFVCSTLLQKSSLNSWFGSQVIELLRFLCMLMKELTAQQLNSYDFRLKVCGYTVKCLTDWNTACESSNMEWKRVKNNTQELLYPTRNPLSDFPYVIELMCGRRTGFGFIADLITSAG